MFPDIIKQIKEEIKELAKDEKSLRSISFSVLEKNKEFTCYFTWKKEDYDNYNPERFHFRNLIKSVCKKYFFKFNLKKSTSNKFIFNLLKEEDNIYFFKDTQ